MEVAETVAEVEAVPEIVGVAPETIGAEAGPGIAVEAGLGIAEAAPGIVVVGPGIGAVAPGTVGLGIVVAVAAVVGTDSG